MTTITVDAGVDLPKTHFRDMEELVKVLAERYAFERAVEESIENGMRTPTSEFVRT